MLEPRTTPKLTQDQYEWLVLYYNRKKGRDAHFCTGENCPLKPQTNPKSEINIVLQGLGLAYINPQGHYEATQFGENVIDQMDFEGVPI